MGFLDFFLELASDLSGHIESYADYKKMYNEYEEEELFDEFVRLSRLVLFSKYPDSDDENRLEVVQDIMCEKKWF
ncbi:MAG: hypothetical protein NC548_37865 [Lachnospiraceae bacterium]|nr:hypothetical protein [Lachnospiraceae bacterium]MCM1231180.1 hypothetical protein [Ruminococcus flavefaciens]